jgi:hypothetical protein
MLHDRFDIEHVTLQLEPAGYAMDAEIRNSKHEIRNKHMRNRTGVCRV